MWQENCKVENSVVARASCPCVTAKMAVLRRTLQFSWWVWEGSGRDGTPLI